MSYKLQIISCIKNLKLEIRNSKTKFSKGFTLVELLLYMGIFTILLTVITTIFTQSIDTQLESQATSSVEQDGRYILAKLIYDINRASSITSPTLGNSASSLQIVVNGVTQTYQLSSGNLTITDSNGTNNLNGFDTSISNLSFRQLGNVGGKNSIRINFTASSITERNTGPEVRDYETTAGIRY